MPSKRTHTRSIVRTLHQPVDAIANRFTAGDAPVVLSADVVDYGAPARCDRDVNKHEGLEVG